MGVPQAEFLCVTPQVVPDGPLDVTLPSALGSPPTGHYHIYSFVENNGGNFDSCGAYSDGSHAPICPTWYYSGYWRNSQ